MGLQKYAVDYIALIGRICMQMRFGIHHRDAIDTARSCTAHFLFKVK